MQNKNQVFGRSVSKTQIAALLCGLLGCLCFGGGDWLMIYGNTAYHGSLLWLTEGTAQIPAWRNTLAMALAFPGILLYGTALFSLGRFITGKKERRLYRILNTYGLTPWLCLHLFYILILYLFGWMSGNGYADAALPVCEAAVSHLSWLPLVSELFMIPPFLYWFYLQIKGKTTFPQWMAFTNILILYGIMYLIKMCLPDTPFKLGFTNGLMSESMFIWFAIMLVWLWKHKNHGKE